MPLRLAVLSSVERGLASRCLPSLAASPALALVGVIDVVGAAPGRWRRWRRKLGKVRAIGLGGALNGVRLRGWFEDPEAPPLAEVCRASGVPLVPTPWLNSPRTAELLAAARCDLALSLGNGYIAPSIFSIPRLGMLNVHCERLPEYRNAASVIWPIHQGERVSGLTIHRIAREIDAGAILYRDTRPIRFRATLEESVRATLAETYAAVPAALLGVCERAETLIATARPQPPGGARFTTPSLAEFRRMRRNHRALRDGAAPLAPERG